MNTRSLLNITRRYKLSNAVTLFDYNIVCLTETWLTKNFESSELLLNNYFLYRSDREGKTDEKSAHGGVLIAVKTEIDSESIKTELQECCIAVKVKIDKTERAICIFYNRPIPSNYRYT